MFAPLVVACCNMEFGGLDGGDDSRWQRIIPDLGLLDADVILIQEMASGSPASLRAHLWRTANALEMIPLLGPANPLSLSDGRTAVLVSRCATIVDSGPPDYIPGAAPPWCYAKTRIAGFPHDLAFYSVHLPPSAVATQLDLASRIATITAQQGQHAIIGGDWNSYGRADSITRDDLRRGSLHVAPARMKGETFAQVVPNYDVHDTLARTGLHDAAAFMDPGQRTPPVLCGTGGQPNGRLDRYYVTSGFISAGALVRYSQHVTASDHQILCLVVDLGALAGAVPRGFTP